MNSVKNRYDLPGNILSKYKYDDPAADFLASRLDRVRDQITRLTENRARAVAEYQEAIDGFDAELADGKATIQSIAAALRRLAPAEEA